VAEAQVAGSLLGTKTALNEFIAYLDLAKIPDEAPRREASS
jgi:CNT family concentrative nucleoside transporter